MRVAVWVLVLGVGCARSGAIDAPEAIDCGDVALGRTLSVPLVLRSPGSAALTLTLATEPAPEFTALARTVVAQVPIWAFDQDSNAVTFRREQAPPPGSVIDIAYTVRCDPSDGP